MARAQTMRGLLWIIDAAAWPAIQISISFWMLRLTANMFAREGWLTRPRDWERKGRIYRSVFYTHRWKQYLPDGASWFGKESKKRLAGTSPQHLSHLLVETRRAEMAHWFMLACTPVLFLWNPPWACGVLLAAGVLANLPCILVQRYNRARLGPILAALAQ